MRDVDVAEVGEVRVEDGDLHAALARAVDGAWRHFQKAAQACRPGHLVLVVLPDEVLVLHDGEEIELHEDDEHRHEQDAQDGHGVGELVTLGEKPAVERDARQLCLCPEQ